jgi:hypothetical protein
VDNPKLNTLVLALVFCLLIEGISAGVNYWASAFSPDTFEDTLCDLYLVVHMPALKLTQIFYPPGHWWGIPAYILFYISALCECWLLTLAAIWILRHFYRRSDDNKSRAAS